MLALAPKVERSERRLDAVVLDLEARSEGSEARPSHSWNPEDFQRPPAGDWDVWLFLGGRGAGKTRTGAEYVLEHLEQLGGAARVGIGAPTFGDARDVCAEGSSGLISIAPQAWLTYNRSLGEARHIGGGYVKFLGSEEPARWNGPQWSLLWADELALWLPEDPRRRERCPSWEQAQFGLRLGAHPRAVVTTTPKLSKWVRRLSEHPRTALTRATTYQNPYLSPVAVQRLRDEYEGTRIGRQELLAEWVDDVPGALWTRAMLDDARRDRVPDLGRVVVAIDPAVTSGEDADETGIVVAGRGVDGRGYVLADLSCRLSPDGWAQRAVNAYTEHRADRIIAEVNNGGDLVERVIRTVASRVAYRGVHASRGKRVRAEPIAALYEQGKVSHCGSFPELEDQMCSFVPDGYSTSPDRVDALVWALTELMLPDQRPQVGSLAMGSAKGWAPR